MQSESQYRMENLLPLKENISSNGNLISAIKLIDFHHFSVEVLISLAFNSSPIVTQQMLNWILIIYET